MMTALSLQAWAQELTYKEIKTIEKTIECNSKTSLSVKGERTFLTVQTWEKSYIQAKIEVISKHTDKTQASTDLEKINVIFDKKGRKIIYSNALRIKSPNDKPKSNLSVHVRLTIPESMDLDISNAFGEIDIMGTYGVMTLASEFTAINIHEFLGTSTLSSKYGDLNIDTYKGGLSLIADRSNLSMSDMTGNVDIEAKYGDIEIYYPLAPVSYKVQVSYSPMSIFIPSGYHEKVSLSCEDCEVISKDSSLPISYSNDGTTQNAELFGTQSSNKPSRFFSEIENIIVHTYQPTQKSN